jgi:hypothetical protein
MEAINIRIKDDRESVPWTNSLLDFKETLKKRFGIDMPVIKYYDPSCELIPVTDQQEFIKARTYISVNNSFFVVDELNFYHTYDVGNHIPFVKSVDSHHETVLANSLVIEKISFYDKPETINFMEPVGNLSDFRSDWGPNDPQKETIKDYDIDFSQIIENKPDLVPKVPNTGLQDELNLLKKKEIGNPSDAIYRFIPSHLINTSVSIHAVHNLTPGHIIPNHINTSTLDSQISINNLSLNHLPSID